MPLEVEEVKLKAIQTVNQLAVWGLCEDCLSFALNESIKVFKL